MKAVKSPAKLKPILLVSLWLTLVLSGFVVLLQYQGHAGPSSNFTSTWPAASGLKPGPTGTLVMFVHPHCPCSAASITELGRLMAHCPGLTAYAVFVRPEPYQAGWERTSLWQRASAIPGLTVIADGGGAICKSFQAGTSGETVLYDRGGRRIFQGGITDSRGHEGDNLGLSLAQTLAIQLAQESALKVESQASKETQVSTTLAPSHSSNSKPGEAQHCCAQSGKTYSTRAYGCPLLDSRPIITKEKQLCQK